MLPLPALLGPLVLAWPRPARAQVDVDRWDLVRVDVPDHPDAIATSATGSVLLSPPADMPWRVEEVPWLDTAPAEEGEALEGVGTWRAWEAEAAMHVAAWHEAGFRGTRPDGRPVKIAVFDVQWMGVESHLAELGAVTTHDCWAHPSCDPPMDTLQPRFSFEAGSHGLGCAEIIRDLAPEAELHLVRVNGVTTLENAVAWAVRNDIDVVSMSMSFFNNSFYDGTGAIGALMDTLHAGGVQMVSSAGNYATEHWRATFQDRDGDGLHEFFDDRRTLPVYMEAGTRRIQITWDDFDACGRSDLDAYLYAEDGRLLARAEAVQDGGEGCAPVERLRAEIPTEGWTYLDLRLAGGQPGIAFDLLALDSEVWQGMAAGSVTDPGSHPAVLTVGAVRAEGYTVNGPEAFSSQGPTNGGLAKPDLAGPDGISTSVYGSSGFYGTSAATPSVAAALVLLMSSQDGLDGASAARLLRGHVLRDRETWQQADPGLGAGKVRLAAPGPPAEGRGCAAGGVLLLLPAAALRRRKQGPGARIRP